MSTPKADFLASLTDAELAETAPLGHQLARAIIAKHGRDRYPTAIEQAAKAAGELGELIEAIFKLAGRKESERPPYGGLVLAAQQAVAKEYGDAGLALFALGDKLGLDLETEMARVVNNETRSFR